MGVLIVAGHLVVDPTERDQYVSECVAVVEAARAAPGCLAFSVTADTVDPSRIQVYERWENEERMLDFRGSGPTDSQQAAIVDADVKRYDISSVGDA
ncbi:MAG TPA: antibiotic biosynthesis monooxygenase family protein [Acidimicrobiia bacterium]|jgi:quinol monooxygenase YgiN